MKTLKYKLLIKALLFSLLLSSTSIYEFWSSSGYSIDVFSEADESFYLRSSLDQGRFAPQEALYYEHDRTLPLFQLLTDWRPDQTYSHFFFGYVANKLGLGILEYSIALDLLFVFLIYITAHSAFFVVLNRNSALCDVGAILYIAFPWLLSIENFLGASPQFFPRCASLDSLGSMNLPVLEGLESQLSIFVFILAFFFFVKSRFSESAPGRHLVCCGLSSGLLIYCYVLGWLSAAVLFPLSLLLCELVRPGTLTDKARSLFRDAVLFCTAFLVSSAHGVYQTVKIRADKEIFVDSISIYREAFYFSIYWILAAAALLLLLFLFRKSNRRSIFFLIISLAVILTEFILANIQPVTGIATAIIFAIGLFTRPIFSCCLLLQILSLFRKDDVTEWLFRILAIMLLAITLISEYRTLPQVRQSTAGIEETIAYLDSEIPKRSVLAQMPFKDAFSEQGVEWNWRWEPSAVAAITNHYMLKEAWGMQWGALPYAENIKRELAVSTLFSGKSQLLRPCTFELRTHPQLFFVQWIPAQLVRRKACSSTREIIEQFSECDAVKTFRADYLVWENKLELKKPEYLSDTSRLVFSSSDSQYQIYKLDSTKLIDYFCRDQDEK